MRVQVQQELTPLPIFPEDSASCDSNSCIYCQPLCNGPFQTRSLSIKYSNCVHHQMESLETNEDCWYVSNSWKFQDSYFARQDPVAGELTQIANFDKCSSPRRSAYSARRQKKVSKVEFSSDGSFLAASNDNSLIQLYNSQPILYGDTQNVCVEAVAKHSMPIRVSTFAWSPHDEGLMLVGDAQGAVSHIHIYSGHFLGEEQQIHNKRVTSVGYSPHNRSLIASTCADGQIILWDGIDLHNFLSTRPSARNSANELSFSLQNQFQLSVASDDCNVYVYDVRKFNTPQQIIQHHQNPVISVKYMENGKMASESCDGQIHVWDMHAYGNMQNEYNNIQTDGFKNEANGNLHSFQDQNLNMQPWKSMNGLFQKCSSLSVRTGDNLIARGCSNGLIQIFNLAWTDPVVTKSVLQQQQQYIVMQQQYLQQQQQQQKQVQQQQFFVNNEVATISWVQKSERDSNLANLLGVGMQQGQVLFLSLTLAKT